MGRRANREGSVYKRKDGRWVAAISIDGQRIYYYAQKQRDVLDWLKETHNQIDKGLTVDGANTKLADYLDNWLASITHLRPKTLYQYSQTVHNHIKPNLGQKKLKDLRPDQIQNLYNQKSELLSDHSVRIIHSVLHVALNQAVRWGVIPANPASLVNKPRPKKKEQKILDENQLQALLSVPSKYRNIYFLAAATGLRQGELLGLQWIDLDWTSGLLQVRRQCQRNNDGSYFAELKSDSSSRSILLGEATLDKLRNQEELQHTIKIFMGKRWIETGVIFHSDVGTPLNQSNLLRIFKQDLEKAALPKIRFHDLRHSAATLMLKQGVHPKIVQARLGHSTISITLDTYSHVIPEMQNEVAQIMDELLSPVAVKLLSNDS